MVSRLSDTCGFSMFLYLILLLKTAKTLRVTLREKYPYMEFSWSAFSCIAYLSAFIPNVAKYEPEKLRIRTLFTQSEKGYETLDFRTTIFHEIF